MKKHLIAVMLSMASALVMADDVIVFCNGDVVIGKVEEISSKTVSYKKAGNLQGPSYTVAKKELLSILYENGTTDHLTDPIKVEKDRKTEKPSSLKFCPQVAMALGTRGSADITGGGGVEFIANFKLNDRIKLGPGVGMMGHGYDFYDSTTGRSDFSTFEIPIFFNAQYNLFTGDIAPYVQGQFGYNFGSVDYYEDYMGYISTDKEHLGVFFKVGAGINFNLNRGALYIDLGYKVQTWSVDTTPTYGELTIGYCFRHH